MYNLELVERLPDDTVAGAAVLLHSLADRRIDSDQAWFWTLDWLTGELEADREAATDPGVVYDDADSLTAALRVASGESCAPCAVRRDRRSSRTRVTCRPTSARGTVTLTRRTGWR